ncbi:MAG: hypothetical protein EB084_16335 [Proteobacteria bacterium]|nr:hypothetical protein [Pseudomonadota bacterium]
MRIRSLLPVLVLACIAVALWGLTPRHASSPSAVPDRAAWLHQRLETVNLSERERTLYRVAWLGSLREALDEAARRKRLVFVASASGDLCSGRL